jgi:hypothetical protein
MNCLRLLAGGQAATLGGFGRNIKEAAFIKSALAKALPNYAFFFVRLKPSLRVPAPPASRRQLIRGKDQGICSKIWLEVFTKVPEPVENHQKKKSNFNTNEKSLSFSTGSSNT